MFDITDSSHSLHWFLYDSSERQEQGKKYNVSDGWTAAVDTALQEVNPYLSQLHHFSTIPSEELTALQLSDVSAQSDFTAVLHATNSTAIDPYAIVIWCNCDSHPTFIPIYSHHYKPLQYPLLFPHGSPRWGLKQSATGHLSNCIPLTKHQ
jgi:hypothetical protein